MTYQEHAAVFVLDDVSEFLVVDDDESWRKLQAWPHASVQEEASQTGEHESPSWPPSHTAVRR